MSGIVNAEEIKVEVKGMVCSMCAQGIQKKFKTVSAVETLDVNLDQKLVTIKTRKGESVPDSVIKEKITEAGYSIGKIERKE